MTSQSRQDDEGKLLENVVYLELRRRERQVSYFKEEQEVDFIITEDYKPIEAIKVCASNMEDKGTFQREISALDEALTKLQLQKGTIITHSREERVKTEKGNTVDLVPAYRWLLEK